MTAPPAKRRLCEPCTRTTCNYLQSSEQPTRPSGQNPLAAAHGAHGVASVPILPQALAHVMQEGLRIVDLHVVSEGRRALLHARCRRLRSRRSVRSSRRAGHFDGRIKRGLVGVKVNFLHLQLSSTSGARLRNGLIGCTTCGAGVHGHFSRSKTHGSFPSSSPTAPSPQHNAARARGLVSTFAYARAMSFRPWSFSSVDTASSSFLPSFSMVTAYSAAGISFSQKSPQMSVSAS